jgi:Ca-activated chloride channel family protein
VLARFLALTLLASATASAQAPVEVVLDASADMLRNAGERTIGEHISAALLDIAAEASQRSEIPTVGLRLAGGDTESDRSCESTPLVLPLEAPDRGRWAILLQSIEPAGRRPLYLAVLRAVEALQREGGSARVVVVTSGADDCGGSAQEVGAALAQAAGAVELRVVGLQLDETAATELASAPLRNTENPEELLHALRWAVFDEGVSAAGDDEADAAPSTPPATLSAPEAVSAGATFELDWTGPNEAEDYLSLSLAEAEKGDYLQWARTEDGAPATFRAPKTPGTYELRYISGDSDEIRARATLNVEAVPVVLRVPAAAVAGRRFSVEWTAAAVDGDFIAIAPRGAPEGRFVDWATTAAGSPVTLAAPSAPGVYEVRYLSEHGRVILAADRIEVRR